jgi:hypothetical protein
VIPAPTLDAAQLRVVDAYRTCEFATLSRAGVPITWPTCTYRRPDGTFLITTSIGLPQKAYNVRRDPRVALLFSDPTGSGIEGAPELLVRGTAVCPDEIATGTAGTEGYWARLQARQPASSSNSANAVSRWVMDFYYMRLHIIVTPTAISTRTPLPPARAAGKAGMTAFPSGVLGTTDADGAPRLLRVRIAGDGPGGTLTLGVPEVAAVRPGQVSLLVHGHDEKLWNLRSRLALGILAPGRGGWTFTPDRFVSVESSSPLQLVRTVRNIRRTAAAYLSRRGLSRPRIAWDEFAALRPRY